MVATLRKAAVAGSWYPADAAAIRAEVDRYLEAATAARVPGRLVALLCPHAGLRYSGPVAAWGYGLLRGRPRLTAVLVGPSHRSAFAGVAVHAHGAWETPLGRVPIDEALAESLVAADATFLDDAIVHREEHSLEMQMPFLQRLVGDLRIVPAMMGVQSRSAVDRLAAALASVLASVLAGRDDVVLVASSDLSHYEPAEVAHEIDRVAVGHVERFEADALMDRLEKHSNVACGGGPLVAVMKAARALGADRATVLRYADSGDVAPHHREQVVGYLSAALTAPA